LPQIPVIIPLIVAGLAAGSAMKSESRRISNRRLGSVSGVAGLLNVVYAYFVYSLTPEQTVFRGNFSVPQTAELPFLIGSFLAGFLVVLVVLGIAKAYARRGKEEEPVEITQVTSEEEPKLKST
jgi:uncharacterized membrane protein